VPAFAATNLPEYVKSVFGQTDQDKISFANFRESVTKTNSRVDRLKTIELPDRRGRYELYGLTDEGDRDNQYFTKPLG